MKKVTSYPLNRRCGFTIVELLTAISVIAILAAITFAATGQVRDRMNATESVSNLRSIGQSMSLVILDGPVGTQANYFPSNHGLDSTFSRYSWIDLLGKQMGYVTKQDNRYVWIVPAHETVFQNPGYEVNFDPVAPGETASYGYNYARLGGWSQPNYRPEGSAETPVYSVEYPSTLVVVAETDGDGVADDSVWPSWAPAGVNDQYNGGGHYLFADWHVEWMDKEVVMNDIPKYFTVKGKW